jgi:nucleoside-diphosphate-sugar epimerase
MRKLVITGALGHIGSRLIRDLRPGEFDEVLLVDNLSTQRYFSLFDLPAGVPYSFVEADILDAELGDLLRGTSAVIHLAAIANPAESFEIQNQVEQVNYQGAVRIARGCVSAGAKLFFLSTTSVYGTEQDTVDEDCGPENLRPQSPYATSKLKAEQELHSLGESSGLRYVIFRFGTIYGTSPGMRFHTAVNKFVWQACLGRPITVWRTALHQKRPYLDLGDAVRALRFALGEPGLENRTYNVVTDNVTVNDIIETIREFVPGLRTEFVDSKVMNQLSYTVLAEKLRSLGFSAKGSLRNGVRETVSLLRGVRATDAAAIRLPE